MELFLFVTGSTELPTCLLYSSGNGKESTKHAEMNISVDLIRTSV